MKDKGIFSISLDFEMYWGVHDILSYEQYQENLDNVGIVVERTLALFKRYSIHATWATVGFLFHRNLKLLESTLPELLPTYDDPKLSPFLKLKEIHATVPQNVLFAPDLIQKIVDTPFQEIATHTFSHYYCLELGQTTEQFTADLNAAKKAAEKNGIFLESIVFPRNQYDEDYLDACYSAGLLTFRGNEESFIYAAGPWSTQTKYKRLLRLADSYLNLTGYHTYKPRLNESTLMVNLPASRFLRPYNPKLKAFETLKIKRITNAMTYAAKKKEVFHLWWHPHNFGKYIDQNFIQLEGILSAYSSLKKIYGFTSFSMGEIAKSILRNEEV